MEEDLPRPLPTQRPRTAGARLIRVRSDHPDSSRQRFDRDPVSLPHLRRQSQPQPPPPLQQQQYQNQGQQQQQQPQQNSGLQRAPGTDRNVKTHTLGEQIHPGDITSVEENDVSLSLHHTARAARGSQPHGKVKDKLRVVEVTGGKLEAADFYRNYFQIHKHGGEVTDVKVDQENKVVFVTFVSDEVAQKVVQDKHMIGNQMVQVKLSDGTYSPPPDYYVDKLFFSNVDVHKDKEHLSHYFQLVSGCDLTKDQILYGDTTGDVLVTFQEPPDEEKTAANCRTKLLSDQQVTVSRVSRSKCIIVENLNPKSTEDGIRNYFENPNRGGAPVHDLKFSLDRRRCFVYFGSSEVAERIAERPHKLDDCPLRVNIYMECLGPSARGFDPRDFYFPESFAVNGADPLVCKFFRETKKVQCQWSKRFKTLHADVHFGATEEDPIMVSCTLEKNNPKMSLVDGWKAKVDATVADMLAAVGTGTVEVLSHSWEDVKNYIKGKLDLNRDTVILITGEDKETVTVVGLNTKLDKNLKKVRKAVANIEKSNMKIKKEQIRLKSFEMNLLEKCGFFQTATRKFTDFKITRDTVRGIVLLEGTLIDIRQAGWDMQKLLRTVSSRQITRLKDIQRALLDKDSTVQSIEANLQKEKVVAIWEKVKKEVKVYAFGEKAAQVTEKAICKQVSMEKCSLSAESTELLDTSEFKETLEQLTNKHPGCLLIESNAAEKKIVMAGYFARETRKQIEAYMLENTIYFETVSFSASRQAIISTEWREKLNTIQSEHRACIVAISFGEEDRVITVKGTSRGLKEVRARLEQLGQEILCHVEQLTQPEKIKFFYSKKCQKQRKWIVHSSHCVISLEQEPAGLEMLQSTRPPTPKPETEDLTDDEETDENDDLSDASSEEDTITEGASSKAAPKKLSKPHKHRRPKVVSEEEEMAPEPDAEGEGPQEARKSVHDKIVIMKADITDMPVHVDAIVNAANSRLEHAGGLAKVIVKKGGQIIQDESCSIMRSRAKELDEGEVVPTGPGQLPCREIFHAVGPRYKDGRQGERERLALAVKNCLQLALDRGYQTIAIPALSTGIFRYPVEEASWVNVKAGKEFLENEPDCCLETVIFCDTSDDKVRHFRSAKEALFSSDYKGNQYDRQAGTCPERLATAKGGTQFPAVPPDIPDIFHQPQSIDELQAAQGFPLGSPLQGSTITTVSVVKGEIAKQHADAIVNSVAKDADLNKGAVSRTLLQLAGPELQAEMRASYPQQLQFGDVAITSGHRLQCRHVLHVCLSDWSAQSSVQLLQQVMSKCLWEADQRGCVSIAFPALGTGNLKFPEAVVAQTMLQAVHHFEQAHPTTGLRKVTMVIYPRDQHIFQAFENVKNQAGAGPLSPVPAPLIHEHSPRSVEPGRHLSPGLPDSESDMPIAYHQDCTLPENPDSELDAREIKEYELLGIRIIVKQGRKESESVDAVVVYSDPQHAREGNYENLEVLTANAAAHNGDWKKCLIHCLKEAADKKYKTIALDSPPKKKGHLEADRFADVLFSAITQAPEDNHNVLQEITIVFMDQRDITIFNITMEKEGDKYNKANPVKDPDDMWSPTKKHFETCEGATTLPENVSLYIYATKEGHIRQFREDFEAFVRDSFASETWKEQQLMKKNKTVFEKIQKVAKYTDVQLTIDRQKGTLTLHGFKEDVLKAKDEIKEIFRKAMQYEHEEEKKEIYDKFAQWSYLQEEKGKGSEIVEYPKEQNSVIEKAFQAKDKTVKIRSKNGKTYVIDFDDMVAYPETNHKDKVSVLRRVKIHDKHEVQIPDTWSVHSQQELVRLVPVSPSSPEFTAVSGNFMASISARQLTIVEITRIQNSTLYQQYQVKKMQMETQNQDVQNVQNEKLVWHGTAKEATDNINNHGFNRSYCGKNATVHGLGVYFAVNSDYSARNTYSPPDADGKRYMYQSRVLVGVSCSSDKDMRILPTRTGNVLYDSACDDVNKPGIYVIFHDTQAYPEYLVTFKGA